MAENVATLGGGAAAVRGAGRGAGRGAARCGAAATRRGAGAERRAAGRGAGCGTARAAGGRFGVARLVAGTGRGVRPSIEGAFTGSGARLGEVTGSGSFNGSPPSPPAPSPQLVSAPAGAALSVGFVNAPENSDGTSSRPMVTAMPATTQIARPG